MVNTKGAADLSTEFRKLSTAERESLAAKASGEEPVKPTVHAFAVVVLPGGAALMLQDPSQLENYEYAPATVEEVFNSCNAVVSDLQASKSAQVVMMHMQQMTAAMANRAQNEQLMGELRKAGAI